MKPRNELKEASLQRILHAGAARLRLEGLQGAAIVPVMKDAGLTHGAFYSHFSTKDELAISAFRHALKDNRPRWMGAQRNESWPSRLLRLGKRYLTIAHRDDLADGCALAALASDAARSGAEFKQAYREELLASLRAICGQDVDAPIEAERLGDAIAFMALCAGGISLARAVDDEAFSEKILAACRQAVSRLAAMETQTAPEESPNGPKH